MEQNIWEIYGNPSKITIDFFHFFSLQNRIHHRVMDPRNVALKNPGSVAIFACVARQVWHPPPKKGYLTNHWVMQKSFFEFPCNKKMTMFIFLFSSTCQKVNIQCHCDAKKHALYVPGRPKSYVSAVVCGLFLPNSIFSWCRVAHFRMFSWISLFYGVAWGPCLYIDRFGQSVGYAFSLFGRCVRSGFHFWVGAWGQVFTFFRSGIGTLTQKIQILQDVFEKLETFSSSSNISHFINFLAFCIRNMLPFRGYPSHLQTVCWTSSTYTPVQQWQACRKYHPKTVNGFFLQARHRHFSFRKIGGWFQPAPSPLEFCPRW